MRHVLVGVWRVFAGGSEILNHEGLGKHALEEAGKLMSHASESGPVLH